MKRTQWIMTHALCLAALIGAQGIFAQNNSKGKDVDALLKRLEEQEKRIDSLEAQELNRERESSAEGNSAFDIDFYGFARLDVNYDNDRANDTQIAAWAVSDDARPKDADAFTIYPRLTRFGWNVKGPKLTSLWNAWAKAKIEVDFYAFPASDSRNLLRTRHTYLQVGWTENNWSLDFLAGQAADLISPLYPAINHDLVMWGTGNLGDRRPQFRTTFKLNLGEGWLTLAGAAGLTGANDAQDFDTNLIPDGESSGKPTLQYRVAYGASLWTDAKFELGVWGHRAYEESDPGTVPDTDQRSDAFGFDLVLPLYDHSDKWLPYVGVRGEWWTGRDLTDVRGGIFQGVNAAGREIASKGGFGQLDITLYKTKAADEDFAYQLSVGFSTDDPDDAHVGAGGRGRSRTAYLMDKAIWGPFVIGFEFQMWRTDWIGIAPGTFNRTKLFFQYNF